MDIIVGNFEKKKVILFRNYSSILARALTTVGAGRRARQTARAVEEIFMMRKLPRKLARHLEMLIAYLSNPSEEGLFRYAIFGSLEVIE